MDVNRNSTAMVRYLLNNKTILGTLPEKRIDNTEMVDYLASGIDIVNTEPLPSTLSALMLP
jgi:hypothetical protein